LISNHIYELILEELVSQTTITVVVSSEYISFKEIIVFAYLQKGNSLGICLMYLYRENHRESQNSLKIPTHGRKIAAITTALRRNQGFPEPST